MRFIEGIGYVDDNYAVNNNNSVTAANKTVSGQFDSLLASETAKLAENGSTTYNLKDIFAEAAEKYNIPQELLEAIGYHESRFQTGVTSSAGAMGIMQLMPGTAQAMGVTDAYDPYDNIMGAAKLLGYLSDLYDGDLKLTLAAYSAGTGNVAKYGGVPPFSETQNYIKDIFEMLNSGERFLSETQTVSTSGKAAGTENASQKNIGQEAAETKAAGTNEKNVYVESSLYNNFKLDDRFTYSEYEMLMEYYTNMLEIISKIGDTDSDDSEDDSLTDLFKLGMQQRVGAMSTENNLINISTTQVSTTSMSDVAAKYMAVSKML
ncbi:MAG: lytic transglycosylase domain-containing protein [Clostridium sp.]|nr:lytic transglycosylase domain-containing protein [Clostridium sp.]MCM1171034.1 lytic transglycosylase domain-containing protein [Clostridium sp.]MCM1208155.1 lytic transglycosylase domain-containing protein [Ruminococcus sp.]